MVVSSPISLRQDKDDFVRMGYSISTMNDDPAASETTVARLLDSCTGAVRIFMDFHTDCVGCNLARFCTVEDVIRLYELDGAAFVKELAGLTVQNPS